MVWNHFNAVSQNGNPPQIQIYGEASNHGNEISPLYLFQLAFHLFSAPHPWAASPQSTRIVGSECPGHTGSNGKDLHLHYPHSTWTLRMAGQGKPTMCYFQHKLNDQDLLTTGIRYTHINYIYDLCFIHMSHGSNSNWMKHAKHIQTWHKCTSTNRLIFSGVVVHHWTPTIFELNQDSSWTKINCSVFLAIMLNLPHNQPVKAENGWKRGQPQKQTANHSDAIKLYGTLLCHILHLIRKLQLQIQFDRIWSPPAPTLKKEVILSHISYISQKHLRSVILLVFDPMHSSFPYRHVALLASGALPSARAAARTISQTWTRSSGAKRFGTSPVFLKGGEHGGAAGRLFCNQKWGLMADGW